MDILANLAGVKLETKNIFYYLSEEEKDLAKMELSDFANDMKIIGLQFHTNKDIKRVYPYGKEVVKYLNSQNPDLRFILFGTEPMRENIETVYDANN